MARLPTATDTRRRQPLPDTSGLRVERVDFSGAERANNALARGAEALGDAGMRYAEQQQAKQTQLDDYDTQKKLLDFKLKSEMALEDARRSMQPGGAGFADGWQQSFQEQARQFVGKDDANIPMSQRAKLGVLLKQHEVAMAERAKRYELAENDKAHVDGLEESLGRVRDMVDKEPDRRGDLGVEGHKLIDMSRLPTNEKARLRKKWDIEMDRTQATSRAINIDSREGLKAFEKELRVDRAPARAGKGFRPDVGAAVNEAAAETGIDPNQLATYIRIESGGDPTKRTGSYKGAGQLSDAQFAQYGGTGDIFDARENIRATARKLKAETEAFERRHGRTPTPVELYMVHQQGVGGSDAHMRRPDAPAWQNMASTAEGRQKGEAWSKQAIWGNIPDDVKKRFGSVENVTSRQFVEMWGEKYGRLSGEMLGDDERGSYRNLTLMQRREIYEQARQRLDKEVTKAEGEINHLKTRATAGDQLPASEVDALRVKIERLGDDKLRLKLDEMLVLGRVTDRMFREMTPAQAGVFAREMRARAEDSGAGLTQGQKSFIDTVEKASETVRKQVNENAMAWAHKQGVEVDLGPPPGPGDAGDGGVPERGPRRVKVRLEQINLGSPDAESKLRERFEMARGVARRFDQGVQVFTKDERDALRDVVAQGGPRALAVLGMIVRNGGDDAMGSIREFSKDAPEAYMLGRLVAEGGDPRLMNDAVYEMKRRATEGDKYISRVDRKMVAPDVAGITAGLKMTPGLIDATSHLTDHVYNFRHRQRGLTEFSADLYKETMQEVLGQRKDEKGVAYGGMGRQGTGWNDGKWQTPVIVPPMLRQDSFDDLVSTLRQEDFLRLGTPRYTNGQPIAISDVHRATWLSLGGSRYALQIGGDDARRTVALDDRGQPFVIDLAPAIPALQRRRPDLFFGYQPSMRPQPDARIGSPAATAAPVPAPASLNTPMDSGLVVSP